MTIQEMRERKIELGYTNEKLAEITKIPYSTIQKIFSGKTSAPRRATIVALEKALQMSMSEKDTAEETSAGLAGEEAQTPQIRLLLDADEEGSEMRLLVDTSTMPEECAIPPAPTEEELSSAILSWLLERLPDVAPGIAAFRIRATL